ncbi:MAG: DUF4212 domain-containing protein [Alphaproteobacteria bacterium]
MADDETGTGGAKDHAAYWSKTRNLMITMMVLWFIFSFLIHFFAKSTHEINFIGFPLSFWLAGQGSLIAFVIMCFWFANKQNAIDEEFGVAEDD